MAELAKNTLTGVAGGILGEVRNLARETTDLFRQLAESSHKTGRIGVPLMAGLGAVLVGAILLCLMFVYLLAWEMPGQPMWVSYASIGFPVLGVGIALVAVGRNRMKALDPLQEQSAKVMRDATEAVEHVDEAVETARQSLHDTAESVREALDIREQINKRPWALMAGAVSLGYLGRALLHGEDSPSPAPGSDSSMHRHHGTLAQLAKQFEPEMAQLKGLALGALLGIVRDLATTAAPPPMERDLEDVIDGITTKLGGTPVQGPVLRETAFANGANGAAHFAKEE